MKFTENHVYDYGLITCDYKRPCMMCGEETEYIEWFCQGRLCSTECYEEFYQLVADNEDCEE